jgi:hypothetical protein
MDKSAVRARLLEYETAIEAIKGLASRRAGRIPPKDWPTTRHQMRDLQKALEEDYRPRSTARGEKAMTEVEHRLSSTVRSLELKAISMWIGAQSLTRHGLTNSLKPWYTSMTVLWYVHKPEGK